MEKIALPAEMDHLEALILFAAKHAKDAGFDSKRIREIELAAEEALVNIFHYAYERTTGVVRMACEKTEDDRFQLEISDDGTPFNALTLPDPDLSLDISRREAGGLGVFFMKMMADDSRYRRDKESNVLTLTFRKTPKG